MQMIGKCAGIVTRSNHQGKPCGALLRVRWEPGMQAAAPAFLQSNHAHGILTATFEPVPSPPLLGHNREWGEAARNDRGPSCFA